MTSSKLDVILSRVDEISESNKSFRDDVLVRLNAIEDSVRDLKEFKGKVVGVSATISTAIGVISGWLFKHLNF